MSNVVLTIFDYNVDESGDVVDTNEPFRPKLSANTVISLNKDVFDLLDVTKQSGEFTYSFNMPATPETMRFFNNFGTLNYVGRKNYISYRSTLTKDGNDIFTGRFVLQAFDQNNQMYKGQLFGRLAYLIYLLKDKKVKDLVYFTPFTHQYQNVTDTIKNSWAGQCQKGYGLTPGDFVNPNLEFFYPVVDMGGMGYFHNENIQDDGSTKYVPFHTPFTGDTGNDVIITPFNGGEFPVAVKLVPVIEAILGEAGFIFDMSHFHTAPYSNKWDNAFIQLPKLQLDDKYKAQALTTGSISNAQDYSNFIAQSTATRWHIMDLNSWSNNLFVNGYTYVAPVDGTYKIRFNNYIDTYTHLTSITVTFYVFINGVEDAVLDTFSGAGEHSSLQPSPPVALVLDADDVITLRAKIVSSNGTNVNYKAGFTLLTNTSMAVIETPNVSSYGKRYLGDYFQDMTQLELLKEFLSMSKSVIDYTEYNDELNINVKPLLALWQENSIPQMDITDKIDRSKKFEVRPATELMPRVIGFQWKEGKDILNKSFLSKVGRGYGATDYVGTGMMYAGKEFVVKSSKFIPYPTGAINWSDDMVDDFTDLICFRGFKDVEKFDESMDDFSLFLWDGEVRSIADTYRLQGIKSAVSDSIDITTYPMCHNLLLTSANNYQVYEYTEDINWEWSVPYSVDSVEPMLDRGNQLYDLYYRKFIEALYEQDTVIVDTGLRLSPREFAELNIWAPVMLDGSRYRILSYKDYDVLGDKPMKVLLVKDNVGEGITAVVDHPVFIDVDYFIDGVPTSASVVSTSAVFESYLDANDIQDVTTVTYSFSSFVADVPLIYTAANITLPDGSVFGSTFSDFDTSGADVEIYNEEDAIVTLNANEVVGVFSGTIIVKLTAGQPGNPSKRSTTAFIKTTSVEVKSSTTIVDSYLNTTYSHRHSYGQVDYSDTTQVGGSVETYVYTDTTDKAGIIKINNNGIIYDYTLLSFDTGAATVFKYMKDISVGTVVINNGLGKGVCTAKDGNTISFEFEPGTSNQAEVIITGNSSNLHINKAVNSIDITPQYRDIDGSLDVGNDNTNYTSYATDAIIDADGILAVFKFYASFLGNSYFTITDSRGNNFTGEFDNMVLNQVIISDSKYDIKVNSISSNPETVQFAAVAKSGTYSGGSYSITAQAGSNSLTTSVEEVLDYTSVSYNTTYPVTYGNSQQTSHITNNGTANDVLEAEVGGNWYLVDDYPVYTVINFTASQSPDSTFTFKVNNNTITKTLSQISMGQVIYQNSNFSFYVAGTSTTSRTLRYVLKSVASNRSDYYSISVPGTKLTTNVGFQAAAQMYVDARYRPTRDGSHVTHTATSVGNYSSTSKSTVAPTAGDIFITEVTFRGVDSYDWYTRGVKVTYDGISIEKTIKEWSDTSDAKFTIGGVDVHCDNLNTNTDKVTMYAYTIDPPELVTEIKDIKFEITGSGQTTYTNHFDSYYDAALTVVGLGIGYDYNENNLSGYWDTLPSAIKYRWAWSVSGGSYSTPVETTSTSFLVAVSQEYWDKDVLYYVEAYDGSKWSAAESYSPVKTLNAKTVPVPPLSSATTTSVSINTPISGGDQWDTKYGFQTPPTDYYETFHITMPQTVTFPSSTSARTLYCYMRVNKAGEINWSDWSSVSSIAIPAAASPPNAPTGLFDSWQCIQQDVMLVTYSWDATPGATSYRFTGDGENNTYLTDTTIAISREMEGPQTVAWSVKAVSAGGTSSASHDSISIPDTGLC